MAERDIVIFVEEASAFEIVRALAHKLGLSARVTVLKHQGSGDLKRSIANKIRNDPFVTSKFLVLCDADGKDCRALKAELMREVPQAKRAKSLIRIVCQELEAWYLAQPEALLAAGALARQIPNAVLNANVDAIPDPKRTFRRFAHEKGQIEHARRIGPRLDVEVRKSASFYHFVVGLRKLANI
jgi:hypothetical protein